MTALALAACSSPKNMSYFDDIAYTPSGTLATNPTEIRIVPDDQLSIYVSSLNPTATMPFNLSSSYQPVTDPVTGVISYQPTGNRSYLVNSEGDITFPVLGKLHVAGMTTDEIADMLYKRISESVENPIVTVKLDNFHVYILGEVARPGIVSATGERFTVLDAIARAGDLTKYAVRDNILLVRDENGKKEYHHLNLKDSRVFESPYFYMRQNDILVVDPNKVAESNATYNTNNAYKIQVTSAIISACSVIASLVIALAVKK
ncbi:MAG: polysaccharide biosynthesis/export family protein [Muribaculaceae bacterium]|nr:polysaccharide biosynthesis/export family protein [Muribaculaceae bacterium]